MRIFKIKKIFNQVILILYLFVCVFFPFDPFNIKLPLLFTLFFANVRDYANAFKSGRWSFIFLWGALIPMVMILYSILVGGYFLESISMGYPAVILLLTIIINKENINYSRIFVFFVIALAISMEMIFCLDILNIFDVNNSIIRDFVYKYGIGVMGKSPDYPLYYKIFLRCSPLIIYVLTYALFNKRYGMALISLFALVISGTRANFLASLLVIVIYFIKNINKRRTLIFVFLVGTISLIWVVLNNQRIYSIFIDVFYSAGAKASNSARIGHIRGLVDYYMADPIKLIFGGGMGSFFYSYGFDRLINQMEWTILEFYRENGIFFTLLLVIFFVSVFLEKKINFYKKVGLAAYLIIAMTNPLLYTSTGYIGYIYVCQDKFNRTL